MGKLYIVGIGPGDPLLRTQASIQALMEATTVIGYRTYVDLVFDLLNGKNVTRSEMREELRRARLALTYALDNGETVALISDGDPQVYGMASPTLELACLNNYDMGKIEIIPGVTAALAAASRLGAPLSMDFAVISLSDLLIPAQEILNRVEKASEGDFVIVFYNLINKELLTKATGIIAKYRGPKTPVGIVRSAYRKGERVIVTDISRWAEFIDMIDMQTTLIIGNSKSYVCNNRIITPRGYLSKYGWFNGGH
ncbi:MAG: cobalt-precorrin-3B C(17)-methyltransferase [Vulcanisaeta sp. JCHS_4]|jgi:precorrin-3 methyltransferase (EC 2.1.1.131)|nr:MAG: cobalt-precorrin-3B C(17)-methyltransferase [Vulcanisaeta sp. JCHS_4]